MATNFLDISPQSVNLFSFILGMTFASFLNWYRRTAFVYIVGYFMALAFYYGAIVGNTQVAKNQSRTDLTPRSEYSPPLPMPEPKGRH